MRGKLLIHHLGLIDDTLYLINASCKEICHLIIIMRAFFGKIDLSSTCDIQIQLFNLMLFEWRYANALKLRLKSFVLRSLLPDT